MYSYLALTPAGVLDGEGQGAASPAGDGRLTLGEAFGLQMNARVVTLSACRTGLGQYRQGEGMIGLTLALFCAGARAATVSLWAVDDARTAQLMGAYHEAMAAGKPPLVALVSAQRGMLAAARKAVQTGRGVNTGPAAPANPLYWAPFILSGQW
jgi:CHAT domain-containing protein